jgi:hypothetical protein
LRDDGTGGDAVAGDGICTLSLEIPPGVAPSRVLLEIVPVDDRGVPGLSWPWLRARSAYAPPPSGALGSWIEDYRDTVGGPPEPRLSVWLLGTMGQDFVVEEDADFRLFAFAPGRPARMELLAGGQPTGLYLYDNGAYGDFAAGDGVFGGRLVLSRRGLLDPASFMLEVQGADWSGAVGLPAPFLTILP